MKKCPYCAEADLQDEALICKHCGQDLKEKLQHRDQFKAAKNKTGTSPIAMFLFVVIVIIVGFFWWPFWFLGILLVILETLLNKK